MTTPGGRGQPPSSRPLTVLFVEDNEDGTVGGSHLCLLNLVTHLDRALITPITLFYQANRIEREVRAAGVETLVWEECRRRERAPSPGPARKLLQATQLVAAIRRRAAFLARRDIDLVHLNNTPSVGFHDWLSACRLLGRACVSHVRGHAHVLGRAVWRRMVRSFDHYIAISQTMADALKADDYPMERTSIVFDTIDADRVRASVRRSRQEVRTELGVPEDRTLLVMAGHLRNWKGQDAVLAALAVLPAGVRERLRVVFAGGVGRGSEAYAAQVQARAEAPELRDCVRFLGERQDVPDLMHAGDAVLHASTLPEPFGLVALEAMALNRPILASSFGGTAEIVAPGTGLLADPRNPAEFARALEQLLDPELRARLAARGLSRLADFGTLDLTARRVEEVYRRLPRLRQRVGQEQASGAVPAIAPGSPESK